MTHSRGHRRAPLTAVSSDIHSGFPRYVVKTAQVRGFRDLLISHKSAVMASVALGVPIQRKLAIRSGSLKAAADRLTRWKSSWLPDWAKGR